MIITEFTPMLPNEDNIAKITSGGRVVSIATHPTKPGHIIVANQFCGLWKTEDGGTNWIHLDGLLTIFVRDVAYSPDGKTVIATVERDNHVKNGGGIWVSHDEGKHWKRPSSGDPHAKDPRTHSKPPNESWIHKRISAYGISYSPDDPKRVYVGTDYGVAISTDNGDTWSHKMLEDASPGWEGYIFGDKSVISILALPNNKAIALCRTGVYLTTEKFDKVKFEKDRKWTWNRINPGGPRDFAFHAYDNCNNIDVSPLDNDKVFIVQDYYQLLLYEVSSNTWTTIPTSTHCPPPKTWDWDGLRGPFVRVSKSSGSSTSIDIWLGTGVLLNKVTCKDIEAVKKIKVDDWTTLGGPEGLHADAGYLGLDNNKLPLIYGCDGGLFKPTNPVATKWARVTSFGLNSLQITDLGGTNVKSPKHTCLYFTTQDNSVWGSGDGGNTWPNNNFGGEGFQIQVIKDAKKDTVVRVAFGQIGGAGGPNRFSEAHLKNPIDVPDVDTDGKKLTYVDADGNEHTYMQQAYFISPDKWIRLGKFEEPIPVIYISQDNGNKWRKIADVQLGNRGVFAISRLPSYIEHEDPKSHFGPVVYLPFAGLRTNPDGSERIGLIRLTDVFAPGALTYDERHLIYIGKDSGSLGRRFTEFDQRCVFGVHPHDPHFIIAPDVYNNKVMVTHDSGIHWKSDDNLTREVTKSKTLLLYDGDLSRMQVTCISFDPYNEDRIYVGTRDSGIVITIDGGKSWSTIPDSNRILYITNFFFEPNGDTVLVSTYGRGLWKIQTWGVRLSFPAKVFCTGSICNFHMLPDFKIEKSPIDWSDKDVTIFLNGRVNGIVLSGSEVMKISVTPGTTFKRYVGKTKNYRDLRIVESKQGEGFNEVKRCLSIVDNEGIIKGVILKENQMIGIISGKDEFTEAEKKDLVEKDVVVRKRKYEEIENKLLSKSKRKQIGHDIRKPILFIRTSLPVMGTNVLGTDGLIELFAKGFKFYSNRNNDIKMMIDSQVINKKYKVTQNGNVKTQIIVPEDLPRGQHIIRVIQKTNSGEIEASESFVKASVD